MYGMKDSFLLCEALTFFQQVKNTVSNLSFPNVSATTSGKISTESHIYLQPPRLYLPMHAAV